MRMWVLKRSGPGCDGAVDDLPSIVSISRVLKDAGVTRVYRKKRRSTRSILGIPAIVMAGIWQQADWVQDRWLTGGIKYNSLQVSDVGSHMMSSGQYLKRSIYNAVQHLVTESWPSMSTPLAMGTDNAFARSSHPKNPWTLWVKVLLMFGVEAIVSPPGTLGFTNHVENINGLWQHRTINKRHYNTLDELRADTDQFVEWANHERAILNEDSYGTEYPAEHVASVTDQLRRLPNGFDIDSYIGKGGLNTLPVAKGRVTFLRHVDQHHTITIVQSHWHVPETLPVGGLVIAGIDTATGQLTIRHKDDIVAQHRYPMTPNPEPDPSRSDQRTPRPPTNKT